eukprot:99588_1
MSWASIVNTKSKKNTPHLKVEYTVETDSCISTNDKDDIPRHREITPHPADDFIMANGQHREMTQNDATLDLAVKFIYSFNQEQIRARWTPRHQCLFYSQSEDKWYPARFGGYVNRGNKKIFTVKYGNEKTATVQRSSPHIQPIPVFHPILFKKGLICKVWSDAKRKWLNGTISEIYNDKGKEYLKVRYNREIFCIQRYDPTNIRLDDNSNHFELLPLSLQIMIKWVKSVELSIKNKRNKPNDLDWSVIENDLKYQCNKYENNRGELKEIYYDDRMDYNEYGQAKFLNQFNKMYFYNRPTIIHYILGIFHTFTRLAYKFTLGDDYIYKNKIIKDGIKIIKLLIIYEIINGDETYRVVTCPISDMALGVDSIFDFVCQIIREPVLIDLSQVIAMFCKDRTTLHKKAFLTITHFGNVLSGETILDVKDDDLNRTSLKWCHNDSCDNVVLHQLLFAGVYPFQFLRRRRKSIGCEITYKQPLFVKRDYDEDVECKINYNNINDDNTCIDNISTAKYIELLMEKYNVMDNTYKYKDDQEFRYQRLIILPLVLYSYLNQVKQEMFELLTNNCCLPNIVIKMVISFIYINYDLFYPKNIRNNIKVQAIDFLNHITHLNMEQENINNTFNERVNDKHFINYLLKDDQYLVEVIKCCCRVQGGDKLLYKLISTENVSISLDAFYYIIFSKIRNCAYHGGYEILIKMLKLASTKYGDQFDINFIWKDSDKYQLNQFQRHIKECMIMEEILNNMDLAKDIIPYILKEYNYNILFKIKCEHNYRYESEKMPFLDVLLFRFDNRYIKLINCLLIECKNKYKYSIDDICKSILNVMENIVNNYMEHWCDCGEEYIDWNGFIKTIENCLKIRCENDNDTTAMNDILDQLNKCLTDKIQHRNR